MPIVGEVRKSLVPEETDCRKCQKSAMRKHCFTKERNHTGARLEAAEGSATERVWVV